MDYSDFIKSKVAIAKQSGFDVEELNPALFPHQADSVRWALKGGRRAIFAAFGNGKTNMGLELAHRCALHTGKQSLIICPLGVKQEFEHDAVQILGYPAPVYVKAQTEVESSEAEILITNYERVRDGDIDVTYFGCTVLDEAAVLRSFGSKTYQTFLDKFKGVQYKFVLTATPDPNKYKELIHYAGYLEIMDTGQALTRFFQRDSTQANNLTIYPHKEQEFWLWVSSWALFYTKPSDLNPEYSDMTGDMGEQGHFQHSDKIKLPDKWLKLFGGHYQDHRPDLKCQIADFPVSSDCCYWMKEKPADDWAKEHNSVPFLGLMASEGGQREIGLMKNGCNYFGKNTIRSCPFAIFTRQDLLRLAVELNVPVPKIYGEIREKPDGTLYTTRAQRTGCSMCGFGIHMEQRPHRFDRLYEDNPREWHYWMNDCCTDKNGEKYGWGRVLTYIGVPWNFDENGHMIGLDGQLSLF